MTEAPRNTFKSPFKKGSRSAIGADAYKEAEKNGSMNNDKNQQKSNDEGRDTHIDEEQGLTEHDMQVNDIMGRVKEAHPEVAKRLHAALTKHLSGPSDDAQSDMRSTEPYGSSSVQD